MARLRRATATLLGDDPAAIVSALSAALTEAPLTAVSREVSYAAALRVARFHTSNEFSDWITVLHTFTTPMPSTNSCTARLRRSCCAASTTRQCGFISTAS